MADNVEKCQGNYDHYFVDYKKLTKTILFSLDIKHRQNLN